MPLSRRDMLHRCAASGLLVGGASLVGSVAELFGQAEKQAGHAPTPVNEMGPFYRRGAPFGSMLRAPGDPGLPLTVRGSVFDTRGEARPDATVEIWQANHLGRYDLEGYHYRTLLQADAKGGYQIETVMPGHYPDRVAQHIH